MAALALVSRHFAQVPQDVIYRAAAPPAKYYDHDIDDCVYNDLVSGVSLLLRTISHRRDFAKRLQCLELQICENDIVNFDSDHPSSMVPL
jgi:hypothetical protein